MNIEQNHVSHKKNYYSSSGEVRGSGIISGKKRTDNCTFLVDLDSKVLSGLQAGLILNLI